MKNTNYLYSTFGTPEEYSFKHNPSDDKRPRCVLMVGNGFSRSYLQHFGHDRVIDLHALIPQNDSVLYYPGDKDRFMKGRLWDAAKFPRLWEKWEHVKPSDEKDTDG